MREWKGLRKIDHRELPRGGVGSGSGGGGRGSPLYRFALLMLASYDGSSEECGFNACEPHAGRRQKQRRCHSI